MRANKRVENQVVQINSPVMKEDSQGTTFLERSFGTFPAREKYAPVPARQGESI